LTRSRDWTKMSSMMDAGRDINQRIAGQVRRLRLAADLSLDALAAKTGVSRSMLSLVKKPQRRSCSSSTHRDDLSWTKPRA
jgi:hypothetical protein